MKQGGSYTKEHKNAPPILRQRTKTQAEHKAEQKQAEIKASKKVTGAANAK